MKSACILCTLGVAVFAVETRKNPLGTVMDLLGELATKIRQDGEREEKAFHDYTEWCDEASQNSGFAIDTATKEKAKLEAKIDQMSSDIEVGSSKIDELAGAISSASEELRNARLIREKEASDFLASEKELMDALSALNRAIGILEKEMSKNPAAFAQVDMTSITGTLQALSVVLDAASLPASDKHTLLALAQSQQGAEVDDEDFGAPAAAVYKTHSTNIVDLLEDMKEKAEAQLSSVRKAEVSTKHNYEMLRQSLEDQRAADKKAMDEEKAGKAAAQEDKATASGDLDMTNKELASSKEQLATCRSTCMQVAADHEVSIAARQAELEAIRKASTVLTETSSGAESQTYSFLEYKMQTHADFVGSEVVLAVRQLAKEQHSTALAQLASRIAAVARYGSANGGDPFAKITGLIRDMIAKLEKEAGDEATEKAYCDEQIAKTEFKKGELEDDISKMTSRIDQAAARSAQLKGEIKELEIELAALAKEQAEMDKIRMETHAAYETAKADLELGLSGVRKALGVLRDYYRGGEASLVQQPSVPEFHTKASGAGGSIIDILEVVESDFATNLAKEETEESDAQSEYEKVSQENAVTKTVKDQDVKYKTQESKSMDATVAEYSADREGANNELSAVLEYYSKIKDRCIAKPETYEDRKKRREAEIKGLQEALTILKEETALVQRKRRGSSFRGAMTVN